MGGIEGVRTKTRYFLPSSHSHDGVAFEAETRCWIGRLGAGALAPWQLIRHIRY
jgi:hypothetical protein